MFQFTHKLPQRCYVAVSGGVDSMSALHFLTRYNKDRVVAAIHFNHNTRNAFMFECLVNAVCEKNNIPLITGRTNEHPPKGESKEKWWRDKRYEFFNSLPGDYPIILAHNLNDCVEEYLMCSIVRGYTSTIKYQNGRCIRPFRLWRKENIIKHAVENTVEWIEDPSNTDTSYKRNYIRHKLLPEALSINPGLFKIVERIIRRDK